MFPRGEFAGITPSGRPVISEGATGLEVLEIALANWPVLAPTKGGTPPDMQPDVSAASPICSDFQTFCPDWLHFGHFLCFGGIAASQLSHRIFPIYF